MLKRKGEKITDTDQQKVETSSDFDPDKRL